MLHHEHFPRNGSRDADHTVNRRTASRVNDLMLDALCASGPHKDLQDELAMFGRFVGSWELECIEYDRDGSSKTTPGEWHFAWVLDGRAVQDVWILPSRSARASGAEPIEWGSAIRFYDPDLGAWRINWSGPGRGRSYSFIAHATASGIVLEGGAGEIELRWTFSAITDRSFRWTNEIRDEDGDWCLQQEMRVRRAASPG